MELLAVIILIGLIPAAIAKSKGRSFPVWWIYGSALFIVALPHALIMRPSIAGIERRQAASGLRKCPFCAEMIKPDAVVCRFCGRDLSTPATPAATGTLVERPAPKPARSGDYPSLKLVLLALFVFAGVILLAKYKYQGAPFSHSVPTPTEVASTPIPSRPAASTSSPRPPPGDDAAYFIWKYGPPDLDESTEHEQPRPKIVTRWLTYRNERVRMIYYPDALPGSPPPYKGWKAMGALDGTRDVNLVPEEIARRMASRKRHD